MIAFNVGTRNWLRDVRDIADAPGRAFRRGWDVLALCECPPIESAERREFELPVRMENQDGELLAELKLNVLVGRQRVPHRQVIPGQPG